MEQIVYRQQLEGVIMVEQVTREENYSMPYRHFHDTFELYYLTEGESYYFIDRETYLVKAGDMVLIKPDRVHKTSLAKLSRHSRILLQITEKAFAPFLNANGFPALDELYGRLGRIVSLREEDRERMKELMLCIGEEIRGRQKRYELMVKMKLLEILLLLSRYQGDGLPEEEGRTAQTPRYQKVQEVVDYLHANPGTGESLEELAGRFILAGAGLAVFSGRLRVSAWWNIPIFCGSERPGSFWLSANTPSRRFRSGWDLRALRISNVCSRNIRIVPR